MSVESSQGLVDPARVSANKWFGNILVTYVFVFFHEQRRQTLDSADKLNCSMERGTIQTPEKDRHLFRVSQICGLYGEVDYWKLYN